MLSEFYRIGFRKRLYGSIADLQPNSINGSKSSIAPGRIRVAGVLGRRQCATQSQSRRKKMIAA
jgi:hypothetical protein